MSVSRVPALLSLLLALGCTKQSEKQGPSETAPNAEPILVVAQEQQASWVRNFNPLLPSGSVRWPTPAGIYEPLLIYNTVKGEYVPWLATKHRFSDDNLTLHFTLRQGVQWSDGEPFEADDVTFTFELMKRHAALDSRAVWKHLEAVTAPSKMEVQFTFRRAYVPGLFRIAQQPIVARHIFENVDDPVAFANENPVATGPFTQVATFQDQVYELRKNPNYWQPDKPKIAGLRFPTFPGNEQANLALVHGEVDWSGKFIPDIQKVFVKKDPKHHKYWFPSMGGSHNVYANTKKPPFDDVRVRKALSMAVDREKLVNVAVYGYTRPANAAGLSEAYKRWYNANALGDTAWVEHHPDRANALLDEAGLRRGEDGKRLAPDGKPLEVTLNVVTGWSDWVTAAQLMISDFKKVGIQAKMKTLAYSAFYEALLLGDFQLSMGWAEEGPTPYTYYQFVMGPAGRQALGSRAIMNWQRFESAEVDGALNAFETTNDTEQQRKLSNQLQSLFSQHAPMIPLYPSPSWGICNTKRFKGFPSAEDPYARLSPFSPPEYLLVLLNLEPR